MRYGGLGRLGSLLGFPHVVQELLQFAHWRLVDLGQYAHEVFLGVDSIPTATLDEGVNDGTAPAGIRIRGRSLCFVRLRKRFWFMNGER